MLVGPDTPVADLNLTGRLPMVCARLRAKRVADLLALSEDRVLSLRGVGIGTLAHLRQVKEDLVRQMAAGSTRRRGEPSSSQRGSVGSAPLGLTPQTPIAELSLAPLFAIICKALGARTAGDFLKIRPASILRLRFAGRGTVDDLTALRDINADAVEELAELQSHLREAMGLPEPSGTTGHRATPSSSALIVEVTRPPRVAHSPSDATTRTVRDHPPVAETHRAETLVVPDGDAPIERLLRLAHKRNVSVRAGRLIAALGIETVGDLATVDFENVAQQVPHIGKGTIAYVRELLGAWIERGGRQPDDSRDVGLHTDVADAETGTEPSVRQQGLEGEARGNGDHVRAAKSVRDDSPLTLLPLAADGLLVSRAQAVINYLMTNLGVKTIGELADLDLRRLAEIIPGVGEKTVAYIEDVLAEWMERSRNEPATERQAAGGLSPEQPLGGTLGEILVRCAAQAAGSARYAEVWSMRRGLAPYAQAPLTLEEVGARLGVTRERVRQIESRIGLRVGSPLVLDLLAPVTEHALKILEECLGLCKTGYLSTSLARALNLTAEPNENELAAFFSILDIDVSISGGVVRHPHSCVSLFKAAQVCALRVADQFPEGRRIEDFVHDLRSAIGNDCVDSEPDCRSGRFSCGARDGGRRALLAPYVDALLDKLHPQIVHDGWVWPPYAWTLRYGTTRTEVVRAALRSIGRPAHYQEIGAFIRRHNGHFSDISDRNVHACLANYSEFVPVGRGNYDLAAVGEGAPTKHVTVAQAITALLKEHGKPMSLSRIVEHLEPQGFQEANVHHALCNVPRFVEFGHRVYTLRSLTPDQERAAAPHVVIVDRFAPLGGTSLTLRPVSEGS